MGEKDFKVPWTIIKFWPLEDQMFIEKHTTENLSFWFKGLLATAKL